MTGSASVLGRDDIETGDGELKLVYPQEGLDPLDFEDMDFRYFFLQPMDGPNRESATRAAIDSAAIIPVGGFHCKPTN